jgi:ubiquinone/menaquinone biosynthesis C-methylase UbiE
MERISEHFLASTNAIIPFSGKSILEIGCGGGNYSKQIATLADSLIAIDPNGQSIVEAKKISSSENISYRVGSGTNLDFEDSIFDIVVFTLSFHHILENQMQRAIEEAVRVVKATGHIIFLEPAMDGTFFEAEILFEACDGDERAEKNSAYQAIIKSTHLKNLAELDDETVFTFTSIEDFTEALNPKKNIEKLSSFLELHGMTLCAKRRINICEPVK